MVTDVNNIITGRPWAHSHFVFFFAVILRNFVRRSSTHNERPARGKIIMTAANNCNSIELIQTISWIYLESAVWLDGAGCRQYPRANPLASGVASELFFFFTSHSPPQNAKFAKRAISTHNEKVIVSHWRSISRLAGVKLETKMRCQSQDLLNSTEFHVVAIESETTTTGYLAKRFESQNSIHNSHAQRSMNQSSQRCGDVIDSL